MAKNGIARFQKKHDEEEDQDKKKMYFDHLTKANAAVQAKFIEKKHCCHQQDSFYRIYPEKSQAIYERFLREFVKMIHRGVTDFFIY